MRIGPAYDLAGTRLQDLDLGCPHCGKRLAEVLDDATMQWNAGQTICIDCGVAVHVPREKRQWVLRGSWRAPGLHVAACQLCRYTSMPTTLDRAAEFAQAHLASSHGEQVAS
jgi:hypothetical protein